jgi:hypothetical protein
VSAPCPTLGYTISVEPRATVDFSALADDLRRLAVANGLVVSRHGPRDPRPLAFEVTREGSQATQADRELLLNWAARWNRVAMISVSDLEDVSSAEG